MHPNRQSASMQQAKCIEEDTGSISCTVAPLAGKPEIDIATLPPLPIPVRRVQRRQEVLSIIVVCGSAVALLTTTLLLAYHLDNTPTAYSLTSVVIVSAAVLLALVGLVGMLCGDPGVVDRRTDTCFPIPAAVLQALEGAGTDGMKNVISEDGLHSYCVRCLVWRPTANAHHCSICQRCVLQFDHHCSFYGRCITDKNGPFFAALPVAGLVGALACFSFCAVCAIVEASKAWSTLVVSCVFAAIAVVLMAVHFWCGCANPMVLLRKLINLL